MPHDDENEPQSPKVSDEERDIYFEDRAQDAWAEFVMNGQPVALANYLRAGGAVDDTVRDALIAVLKGDPRSNPGGSKPFRDWQTFVLVSNMLLQSEFQRKMQKAKGEPTAKRMTKRQALSLFAQMNNRELRTVELQYKRGEKTKERFEKPTKN